jgi:2-enoate reductase
MDYDHLFSPIKLGNIEIKNRIMMAPMGTDLPHPVRRWGEEEIVYFAERAKGEVGLIMSSFTHGTGVLADIFRGHPLMAIIDDSMIPIHEKLVKTAHQYGSKMFCQIAALGGKFGEAGPSSIHSTNFSSKPRELSNEEVWQIIDDFGQAARRAREAGYDGAEIHGGHGYLLGQFISPAMNMRTDEFGGSLEGRLKVVVEIFQAMKKYAGEDFPVGIKFSAWEDMYGGTKNEEAARIAKRMADEGVCYLHVASLNTTIERVTPYSSVPPMYTGRNTLVPLAENVKKAVKDVPVVGVGSIIRPEEADQMIADGQCDMVALGRTLLADAHWGKNAKEGKRIRPCIRCNVCHHQLWLALPIVCTVNPYLVLEAKEPVEEAGTKKKVMVVGAGPGGINAALVASRRGHDVTLYEKQQYIGGMLYPGSRPECKEDVRPLVDYYEGELSDSTVKVKTGVEVTPELVEKEAPDALVIAVGGKSKMPEIIGIDGSNVVAAVDALRDSSIVKGDKVVIIGGGDVGCETACHLADEGKEVTIVEILPELMTDQIINNVKMLMFPLLDEKGVKYFTSTTTTMIHEGGVEVTGAQGGRTLLADTVVVATGLEPDEETKDNLRLMCGNVYVVGDCGELGRIREAVRDGDLVGRLI